VIILLSSIGLATPATAGLKSTSAKSYNKHGASPNAIGQTNSYGQKHGAFIDKSETPKLVNGTRNGWVRDRDGNVVGSFTNGVFTKYGN
jgi:hypothetical protein